MTRLTTVHDRRPVPAALTAWLCGPAAMLVEPGAVEQRYRAVLQVLDGAGVMVR